jgi:sortase A
MLVHAWCFQVYENRAFDQELAAEERMPPLAVGLGEAQTADFRGFAGRPVIGRIEIPRIGLKAMILEGATSRTLALALGHIPGTALPGSEGNIGIAGHRDTFFRGLRGVHPGDAIVLTTRERSYHYRVQSCEVVGPLETRVLGNTPEPALTLVTCYPFYYVGPAPQRFIVHATRSAG